LLAVHGNELSKIAEQNNVCLNYEAAIAGGIPIVKAVRENLRLNKINKIYGILNGTCNYILTKMENNAGDFKNVLNDAQKKGFAELDPTFDIQGIDAAHKITLLSSIAFDIPVNFKATFIEGITKIDKYDFVFAKELGYSIKLLSVASKKLSKIEQRVHPCFVKLKSDIAKVSNEINAVVVNDSVIGKNIFEGPGAGAGPTGASVMSDLMDIIRGTYNYPLGVSMKKKKKLKIQKIDDLSFPYYLRITAKDKAGVMAKISKALSKRKISIESIIQKPSKRSNFAEIILITHTVKESSLLSSIKQIKRLPEVSSSVKFIRIEDSL
jgi:homoserine dehydrogenase